MRENKKDEKGRNGHKEQKELQQSELLADAFNDCMEEQLSFIPSEREIARMHEFSEEFKTSMEHLCRTNGKLKKQEMPAHEFMFRFHNIAACLFLMLLIGGICVGGYLISEHGFSDFGSGGAAVTAEDTAETSEEIPEEMAGASVSEEEIQFAGEAVQPAPEQELPSGTEEVRTLVSSPVLDREAQEVKVTIGNLGEETLSYSKDIELQVCMDGVWYIVPKKEEGAEETEDIQEVKLEAGMAQDEEVWLSDYWLDYEAEKYRTVICVDGIFFGSEFRFETLEEGLEEALERNPDISEQ